VNTLQILMIRDLRYKMREIISVPRLACITAAGKVLSIEKTFVLQLKSELCLKIVELIALVLCLVESKTDL
jgi:hypothetical protein